MRTSKLLGIWSVAILVLLAASCKSKREIGPPKDNVYRAAIRIKFTTLDPHFTTDIYSLAASGLVVENLYEYHYLKRPRELQPLLAESLPLISKDFKTFTFKLKKGIKYQDNPCFKSTNGKGTEVSAEDFSYSIHRIASPKKMSPTFSFFENTIEGIDDYHAGKAEAIKGVKVVDSHTLEIKLSKASPRFAFNFTDPRTGPLPKECVENLKNDITNTAIGSGPYKIVEWDPNSKLVAVRNPEYKTVAYPTDASPELKAQGLLADAGKPLPFVDKVSLRF